MARYPVVVDGDSGCTSMLIMDRVIDRQVTFRVVEAALKAGGHHYRLVLREQRGLARATLPQL